MPVVLAAVLKAHHDDAGVLLQHLCGQAGHHIALVYGGGDVRLSRRLHHGIAGVAAGAHHQVGLEIPQDGACLPPGGGQHPQGVQVVADALSVQLPLEAADLHGGVVVPRLGHQLPLHARGRAHEQHGGVRLLFPHIARQRQRRIHMSCGAAAGKYHSHTVAPASRLGRLIPKNSIRSVFYLSNITICCLILRFYPARAAGICRDTLSTMPISTSCRHSAVPP